MRKFTVNHISLVEKGVSGPWGYGLVSGPFLMADGSKPDVVELRGLGLETFERIARALPAIKAGDQVLTCEAEVRTEERLERFTTKAGEAATKTVVRLYLESTPVWAKEARPVVSEGNLGDILGDDDDPFS